MLGSPPQSSWYIALCPAAQMPRTTSAGFLFPVIQAGTKSASSTHEYAASNTSGATRLQCRILDHHHSEEYTPPHLGRYGSPRSRAFSVISAASAWEV